MWGFGKAVPENLAPKSDEQLKRESQWRSNQKAERLITDTEIALAVFDIPGSINIAQEFLNIRAQLQSVEGDEERRKLHIRYAALMEYDKAMNAPVVPDSTSLKDLRDITRLPNPEDERRYPDFQAAARMRVQRIGEQEPISPRGRSVSSPSSYEKTAAYIRPSVPPEIYDDRSDAEQAAK